MWRGLFLNAGRRGERRSLKLCRRGRRSVVPPHPTAALTAAPPGACLPSLSRVCVPGRSHSVEAAFYSTEACGPSCCSHCRQLGKASPQRKAMAGSRGWCAAGLERPALGLHCSPIEHATSVFFLSALKVWRHEQALWPVASVPVCGADINTNPTFRLSAQT